MRNGDRRFRMRARLDMLLFKSKGYARNRRRRVGLVRGGTAVGQFSINSVFMSVC